MTTMTHPVDLDGARRTLADIEARYAGTAMPFPVGADLMALISLARQVLDVAYAALYLQGDTACTGGECDHFPDDEDVAAGTPRPDICPMVEIRYATSDQVIDLDRVRDYLADLEKTDNPEELHEQIDHIRALATGAAAE